MHLDLKSGAHFWLLFFLPPVRQLIAKTIDFLLSFFLKSVCQHSGPIYLIILLFYLIFQWVPFCSLSILIWYTLSHRLIFLEHSLGHVSLLLRNLQWCCTLYRNKLTPYSLAFKMLDRFSPNLPLCLSYKLPFMLTC